MKNNNNKRGPNIVLDEQYIKDRVSINAVTGCWNWIAARTKEGYGAFCLAATGSKIEYAHRFMFKLYNADAFDPSLQVMHKCDNPRCCNPDHLEQGTPRDNSLDASRKRRRKTILNERLVRELRTFEGSAYEFARRNGLSRQAVLAAKHGRTWAWLDGEEEE